MKTKINEIVRSNVMDEEYIGNKNYKTHNNQKSHSLNIKKSLFLFLFLIRSQTKDK